MKDKQKGWKNLQRRRARAQRAAPDKLEVLLKLPRHFSLNGRGDDSDEEQVSAGRPIDSHPSDLRRLKEQMKAKRTDLWN